MWIGTLDQRFAAAELYAWLIRELEQRAESAKVNAPAKRGRRAWMHQYRLGVAQAVAENARRISEEYVSKHVVGEGLVRLDALKAAINAHVPANLRSKALKLGGAGYASGYVDGKTIELRKGMESASGAAPNRRLGS